MRAHTTLVTGLLTLAGCVGLGGRSEPASTHSIEQAEIAATGTNNAYDAVLQLRPNFLRGRAVASGRTVNTQTPVVFLDDTRLGDLEQLRTIPTSIIRSIHLISAADATTRWGTGYSAGVIEVRTRS